MDDHNFIHFSWSPKRDGSNYDEIIENDDIDELNDMIEEQVEGYEEVNILEENSDNDNTSYNYIQNSIMLNDDDDGIMSNSVRIGVGMSHLIEQRVQEAESKIIGDQDVQEEFTAEVITEEDWIQSQGEEIVPVAMEQIVVSGDYQEDETDAVPLQTDQDEYTTSRPYPCDFCSRRFRKKANLINHMVAHQNVRPHMCNLCGSRYVRKCDLINHLKIHAYNIEDDQVSGGRPSTSGGKKNPTMSYDELSFLDDLQDEDEFDYNHYSKPVPSNSKNMKRLPPVKKPSKFEKTVRGKSLSDLTTAKEPKRDNIEKFPPTDARKPFVCQNCGVAFTREKALESHTKVHANQEPSVDCEICGDSFFDNATLEEHMDSRHDYSSRFKKTGGKTVTGKLPRQAQLMDFDDSNSSEFEPDKLIDDIDLGSSEYDDDNTQTCDKCDLVFKSKDALKRHIKAHCIKSEILTDDDENESNFSVKHKRKGNSSNLGCNVCGESFTEALDLLAHAEIHARFQPFKCLLCGETFFEENKIKIHLMDNHRTEMTESSCKLCGKQCRDQRSLIKHSWEHSRDRAHSCSKCGKTFHNKARLKRHISSHRNKSVVCEICHEEFSDGRQLMNHRHSHTKSNQFPCTECGKTFGSRSSQQIHIRIHTGERPYACRFCWKAFADGGTLRKHERIHTGEKPYCCLVCPRAFNQRVVLREHIRSHHSAPDPQHGTTLTPFYCSLCGDLFSASLELISHLIEHSDRSTAAKRIQPTGPRKYKRRRKLSDQEMPNSLGTNHDLKYSPRKTTIKKEPLTTPMFDMSKISKKIVEFQLPDEIFETGTRDRCDKKPSMLLNRAKMIYTEKSRVPPLDKKKRTKTLIYKQVLGQKQLEQLKPKEVNNDTSYSESETCSNEEEEDALDVLLKRERKLSEKFTVDLVNDLQEILRSPLKINEKLIEEDEELVISTSNNIKVRRSVRQTPSRYGSVRKTSSGREKKDIDSDSEGTTDKIIIKQEFLLDGKTCEICGDSFESRDELVSHIPIHI